MQNNRRVFLLSASALVLAGCGGLGLGPANPDQTMYVLQPALATPPQGAMPVTWALGIDIPESSDALDTQRIALIRNDATLDYYANAQWPDRMPMLVQTALLAGFQTSGRVPSVSRTQEALHADFELSVEIRDFAAHYSASDDKGKPSGIPKVTVTLIAQMTSAHGRKILANITATQSADAGQNSTGAVVQAFNSALGAAVQQIVTWSLGLTLPVIAPTTP